ncbi:MULTISPECIES: class I adenylate-forming enzyme family protein [unclassified Paraburkholderia]|uniref:class I adenylate-forming enzyme family protein n=1 Tax=unclassified Paraburkholderia TaxID=2615204 RepID=UPI002AB219DE|nr:MULTISPECIES: class I adenylate-forming enzyme family protein [unclassified Paraburkholderia]
MTAITNSSDVAFASIGDQIRRLAVEQGEHAALICEGKTYCYADLDAMIDRCASALQREGIAPEDVVAICAEASPWYVAVFLGALRAGAAVAPLAPSSHPDSLAGMIENAGARVLFLDADVRAALKRAAKPPTVRSVRLDAQGDAEDTTGIDAWLAPRGAVPRHVDVRPEWAFNIIYSSGTTGLPKGIVQSHAMRFAYAQRSVDRGYGPQAVTLISTPLYSNTTLVSFFPTLALGGTVVLMPKFDTKGYLALAQQYRATHTMLVPVQYQRLMAEPDFDRYDLSNFVSKSCTSAPFSARVKADVVRRWPGSLTEFYGMTEGGASCELCAELHPDKLHTVGRVMSGHEMRLIDPAGNELPRDSIGEIVGRSPTMMTGYYRQPEKTAEAEWYDRDGQRFIRTGDIGRFDEDGFLVLMDRKKDMIISGGFNVYPSDLEQVLLQHPQIAEAAVVGVTSERWGETPVAFVTLHASATVDASELAGWANERLGKMQRLAEVVIADSLPRSAIGKVLKRELRESFKPSRAY